MIRVEEVNDRYELAGYRLIWNSLFSQTPGATFFHSLDWLQTYWEHYGQDQQLRVLFVSDNGRPIGILPLVVRAEASRVGRVRVLTYPLHDWGTYYGPIGPNPTATLLAGLRHIRQTPRTWDMLDLRWVDLDGTDRGRTERAMQMAGFSPQKQGWTQSPMIEIGDGWDAYWQSRPKRWRHNLERLERRLQKRGEVSYVRYRPEGAAVGDGDPRWALYDACEGVAQRSWQGSSTTGTTLSHASVRPFLRQAHEVAARNGMLDLNLLMLGGKPIAYNYGYQYDGHVYGVRKGFDAEYKALAPGNILQRKILEDGARRGDQSYDMGADYLDGKRQWQTALDTCYRFTHFPIANPRVQLLRVKRWLQQRVLGVERLGCGGTMA